MAHPERDPASTRRRKWFAVLAALTLATAANARQPDDDHSRQQQMEADGYEFAGTSKIVSWLDANGNEVDGCERDGVMHLANGLVLHCTDTGLSSGRDAVLYRKGDYYRVIVGVDTYLMHN